MAENEGDRGFLARLGRGRFGGRLGLSIIALGLLVIGLGWNGAAGPGGEINHVPTLQAQLPWLLSGGFLGLGLVVVGAALLVTQHHAEERASLEGRLDALIEAVSALDGLGAPQRAPADLAGLAVAGTDSYHRPDCRLVARRGDARYLTPTEAVEQGLHACRVCRPPTPAERARN